MKSPAPGKKIEDFAQSESMSDKEFLIKAAHDLLQGQESCQAEKDRLAYIIFAFTRRYDNYGVLP